MFKLRKTSVLPATSLFDERNFYKKFVADISRAKRSIVIESPYMTERRTNQLIKHLNKASRRGVEIKVYTREPAHHDPMLESESWKAIELLRKAKVRVFACADMRHRKIAIIDDELLWEGSLNILSQSRSREIMRRTVSKDLVRQMQKIISK